MSVYKQFKVVSQYVHKTQHAGTFQGHTTALVLLASLWWMEFAYVSTYIQPIIHLLIIITIIRAYNYTTCFALASIKIS